MDDHSASPSVRSLPKKLIVAVDPSKESLQAARYAIELARHLQAELSALHVVLIPEYISGDVSDRLAKELGARGASALQAVKDSAEGTGVVVHEHLLTTTRSVVATICRFAAEGESDLIVMGTRGEGGVAKLMLGSVAAGVVREAPCPVLVVR